MLRNVAIEAQAFSLKMPEQIFGMFSPARSEGAAKAAKDRLEEDIRFVAKSVRDILLFLFIPATNTICASSSAASLCTCTHC